MSDEPKTTPENTPKNPPDVDLSKNPAAAGTPAPDLPPEGATPPEVPPSDYLVPAQLVEHFDSPLTPSPVAVSNMGAVSAVVNDANTINPSGYPIILNGDHAEFEAEWADKDPKTRPDWPMPSMDAMDWAEAFANTFKGKIMIKKEDLTGTMLAWFSGALMRGYDEARARAAKELEGIVAEVKDKVEAEKSDLKSSLEQKVADVYAEAQAKGKTVWLKYGGVFAVGIAIGVYFAEFFQTAATSVNP